MWQLVIEKGIAESGSLYMVIGGEAELFDPDADGGGEVITLAPC